MRTIRPITLAEIDAFTTISANAYPGIEMITEEARTQFMQRVSSSMNAGASIEALFDEDQMRGVMRIYDFTMTFGNGQLQVGGVGGVAVDLAHKKERVAFDMIVEFVRRFREKGHSMVALYPFRPDFYHKMGFGFGAKIHEYRFAPASMPRGAKAHVAFMTEADKPAVIDCYERYRLRTHGMFNRDPALWDGFFTNMAYQMVGVKRNGRVTGYLSYQFRKGALGHFLDNDLLIREWVYDSAEDLRELAAFLHSQADQFNRVIYHSFDPNLHFLLHDPRDGSGDMMPPTLYHASNRQGVGLMWRVVNVPRLFELLADHDFGGQSLTLAVTVRDSFFPENAGTTVVTFENGRAVAVAGLTGAETAESDVAIELDIADFSSLVVGGIRFDALAQYGLVTINDPHAIPALTRLFAMPAPICLTSF